MKSLGIHPLPLESEKKTHQVSATINTESFKKNAVLLVDNLDSFTYNIAHDVCGLGHHVNIISGRRETQYTAQQLLNELQPSHVILGPGPGWPNDSRLTMEFAQLSLSGDTPPLLGDLPWAPSNRCGIGTEFGPKPNWACAWHPCEMLAQRRGFV